MSARPKASQRAIGWSRALGLSAGLHGLIVLGLVFAGGDAPAKPLQHAIVAELVAKGEEQKKKELPRRVRTTSAPASARQAPGPQARRQGDRASADEAPNASEALAAGEEADEALAQLGQQEQTGMTPRTPREEEGSEQGTLAKVSSQLQNSYRLVGQAIKADGNYRISDTISAAERVRLVAVLFLAYWRSRSVAGGPASPARTRPIDGTSSAAPGALPAPPKRSPCVRGGREGTFRP